MMDIQVNLATFRLELLDVEGRRTFVARYKTTSNQFCVKRDFFKRSCSIIRSTHSGDFFYIKQWHVRSNDLS